MVEYYDPERRQGPPEPPRPSAITGPTSTRPPGTARFPVLEIVVLLVAGGALVANAWWQVAMFGEGLGVMWAVQLLYPVLNVAAVAAIVSLVLRRSLHRHHEAHADRLAALHAELAALRAAVDGSPGDRSAT